MYTSFLVWIKAQGIYAILMLPTLMIPPMFMMAEFYALLWGLPAFILFSLVIKILKRKKWFNLPLLLAITFLVTMLSTFGAAWHFESFQNPWKAFIEWIIFPAAGCGAAILSVIISRKKIRQYILNEAEIELVDLETQVTSQNSF